MKPHASPSNRMQVASLCHQFEPAACAFDKRFGVISEVFRVTAVKEG